MNVGITGGKCSKCGKEYKPRDTSKGIVREIDIVFGSQDVTSDKEPTLICIECHRKRKEKWKEEIQFKVGGNKKEYIKPIVSKDDPLTGITF